MQIQNIVGQPSAASLVSGISAFTRGSNLGATVVTELHGKYFEQNYRGNLFATGNTVAALSANSITLTATTTPIIGAWNPSTSTVNLVIAKAVLQLAAAGNSAVAPGGFVWATSVGNAAISTGNSPLNRKTLVAAGSQAKGFNLGTALTGLTNNLVIQFAAAFGTLLAAQGATATPLAGSVGYEEFDGSLIIPPGGVLALLNTVSTTTVSVAASLVWEEVPI
jgi:hypothetical protein